MPSMITDSSQELLVSSNSAWNQAVAASGGARLSINDFELGRTIGIGRFARVRLANLKKDKAVPICLKVFKKSDVCRLEQVGHIMEEKNILATSRHPFIIRMLGAFQDAQKLYMALELVNGGELFTLLRSQKMFELAQARFYLAEVVSAISYLHQMLIMHRDIKPENLLIHRSGHLKLTDFGFAKYAKGEKTFTVCGTAAYMAPEVIRGKTGYGLSVDLWACGILLFEMVTGQTPFSSPSEAELLEQIAGGYVRYPAVMKPVVRDLVTRLLVAQPSRRLGLDSEASPSIRDHDFFKSLDWEEVDSGKLEPPWKPQVTDANLDTSLFEKFDESTDAAQSAPVTDAFESWIEVQDFREEALALAQDRRNKSEQRRLRRHEEKQAEAERLQAEKEEYEAQLAREAEEAAEKARLAHEAERAERRRKAMDDVQSKSQLACCTVQ